MVLFCVQVAYLLESGRVVHAISCHADNMPESLGTLDCIITNSTWLATMFGNERTNLELMLRRRSSKHDLLFRKDCAAFDQQMHKSLCQPLTLIPLPPLKTVDVVTMNDNGIDFVFVDLLELATCLRAQGLPSVAQDEVDLASNGFRCLRMIACQG